MPCLSLTSHYDTAKLQLTICERPAEEAKVTKVTHQETREWELIVAFTETIVKPRSIEITGSTSAKIAKWLQNFDGTIQESEEVVTKKINDKLAESNTALQAECWQEAHDKALSCQGLMDIATKCDVARRRYENIVPNFPSIGSQCLSNISLARLKLGDAEGAYKNCRQIKLRVLPQRCLFDAHLREAMAAVASNHFPNAYRRFKAAHKISPSHPQPREELMAFEEHLIRETDVKQGIKSDTAINLAILRDVTKLLRS